MKRWLFNLAAGVSLVLCLATAGLWVRSYFVYDIVRHPQFASMSVAGRLVYLSADFSTLSHEWAREAAASELGRFRRDSLATNALNPWWNRMGFGAERIGNDFVLLTPHWSLVLLFAALPLLRLSAALRARRRRIKGICLNCGYDLRATPQRCPECGTVAADAG